ncbi:MAG: phage NrS-1 polymerase family protein [Armatimonadota bacterium]
MIDNNETQNNQHTNEAEAFQMVDLADLVADYEADTQHGTRVDTEPEGYPQPAASTANAYNYNAIPDALKQRNQWALFNCVKGKDGHTTKKPFRAGIAGRQPADSTDPNTWAPFDAAVASRTRLKVSDIAYAFNEVDPFTVVDLDGVIDPITGAVDPWAQSIINRLDSYTEISRSRTGFHVIVKGTKPGKQTRTINRPNFEIYDDGRFMICTGLHVEGTPTSINERQEVVEALYGEVFGASKPEAPAQRVDTGTNTGYPQCGPPTSTMPTVTAGHRKPLDDSELLELAMSSTVNGSQFTALWHGDISAHSGNHSAADQALVNMLAYWSGRDAAQMDRLFRQSGLMRPKWNEMRGEATYGQITINKAITDTPQWYGDGRQPAKVGNRDASVSTPGARSTGKGKDEPPEPLPATFTEPMRKYLQAIYAFTPSLFNDKDTVGYEVMHNLETLPLEKAAIQLYNTNQLLSDCERLFLFAQLKGRRIDSELVNGIMQVGTPREPLQIYSLDDLLKLDIPEPEYLPLLGEDGSISKAFVKGMSHLIVGKPSGGKTHVLAQSAMYWNQQPVIHITEEPTAIWKYRIQSYLNAGLPNNPYLSIRPALGEGNGYVMEQIKQADSGSIIIIDTLRAFAGVTKEDDGAEWCMLVDPWLVEARRNDITTHLIHHSRKGKSSGDPIEDSSGSNGLPSRFEQRIGITARADGSITIGGRAKNWVITQSNWRRAGDRFTRMTSEEIKKQDDTLQTAILECMNASDTVTPSQLYKRLTDAGVTVASNASVRTALNKLATAGEAININAEQKGATGAWKLTANLINSTESEEKG